jgi:hypothetical protein
LWLDIDFHYQSQHGVVFRYSSVDAAPFALSLGRRCGTAENCLDKKIEYAFERFMAGSAECW